MAGECVCICSCVPTPCSAWGELSGCVISLLTLAERPPQLGQGWDMFGKTGVQDICCVVQSFEQHTERRGLPVAQEQDATPTALGRCLESFGPLKMGEEIETWDGAVVG